MGKTIAALLASAVAAGLVAGPALAAPASSATLSMRLAADGVRDSRTVAAPPDVFRIAGADRIATSVAVSENFFDDKEADVVVLASKDSFADATTGGPLAAKKYGPLLLTPPAGLDGRVADEIRRVLVPGGKVYLMGGSPSLSPAVEAAVRALGFPTQRFAGVDRFETSVLVAREITKGGPPIGKPLLLATGLDFPDALAAGAASRGGAVLLTNGTKLPKVVKDFLSEPLNFDVTAIGGAAAAAMPNAVMKVVGVDRYDTAVKVANTFWEPSLIDGVGIASGASFPDALSATPVLALTHSPLLLTKPDALPTPVQTFLTKTRGNVEGIVIFGGLPSVNQKVENQITAIVGK